MAAQTQSHTGENCLNGILLPPHCHLQYIRAATIQKHYQGSDLSSPYNMEEKKEDLPRINNGVVHRIAARLWLLTLIAAMAVFSWFLKQKFITAPPGYLKGDYFKRC